VLSPVQPNIATNIQLAAFGPNSISQVVTVAIDNSNGAYALKIVHGALNETTVVPAFSTAEFPTFSNKASYPINVSFFTQKTPTQNVSFRMFLMNYERPPGSYPATYFSSLPGSGQNVVQLYSNLILFQGGFTAATPLLPGNYTITDLELTCEGAYYPSNPASGPGTTEISWDIFAQAPDGQLPVFDVGEGTFFVTATAGNINNWFAGANLMSPFRRNWPNGWTIPNNGYQLFLQVSGFTEEINPAPPPDEFPIGVQYVYMRINISGTVAP
jgi:hypothetical protein